MKKSLLLTLFSCAFFQFILADQISPWSNQAEEDHVAILEGRSWEAKANASLKSRRIEQLEGERNSLNRQLQQPVRTSWDKNVQRYNQGELQKVENELRDLKRYL